MEPLFRQQIELNRRSEAGWESYEPHRRRVSSWLLEGEIGGNVCLLGAGNLNDVELPELCERFSRLVLVDLDEEALQRGVQRQLPSGMPANLRLRGNFDVTGVLPRLGSFAAGDHFDDLLAAARKFNGLRELGEFELVGSLNLLSQIIDSAATALPNHPRLPELIATLRDRHLQQLVELVSPGGRGLLVTDFVSSDTAPELAEVPEPELSGYLMELLAAGNCFLGCDPRVLLERFRTQLAERVSDVQLSSPWRWELGARTYAVTALRFRRR